MSLSVTLNRFKIIKNTNEKYARLSFRGAHKYSAVLLDYEEMVTVNQRFHWDLNEAVSPGEVLILTLLIRARRGAARIFGVYRLGLQMLVAHGQMSITDTLLDDRNKVVPAFVDMDVYYTPPIMQCPTMSKAKGKERFIKRSKRPILPSVHGSKPGSAHGSGPSSTLQSDLDEDLGKLDDIEKNIASFEQALHQSESHNDTIIDMESDGEPRSTKFKFSGKRFYKRATPPYGPLSIRAVTSTADDPRFPKSFNIIIRRINSTEAMKTAVGPEHGRKKSSPFKSIKNLMRLGKQRSQISSDEEQGLMPVAGPSSAPDFPASHTSATSDELLVDIRSTVDNLKVKKIRTTLNLAYPSPLKAADFQVCITIIEARQLAGLNMDLVVCIEVGDSSKYTSVKESTNSPYYNEYFVFDFHMAPVMLFDKIIMLSVLQSRNFLRANKLLGSFKLDVATVWSQIDRQFYHKWAVLTDPDDINAGPKGYLKCDISVIGKGDPIKIPPISEKDDDDIETNLLLPDGVPIERQLAKYVIKIHSADGLPKMNYSILANVKQAITGETQDLVDPYVLVAFAGMTGSTSVKKNCSSPEWNEQIVFTEMFPSLCQRIKIQLRDNDPVHPNIIGTHFIDLKTISNDGEKGFLPTFGPAYIYLYGSTRDYSLLNQHSDLNAGIGEGVAYRARILVSINIEIIDNIDSPTSEVEIEPIPPINISNFENKEEFFLFSSIFDANMIDKRLVDKQIQFELSIGNCGNTLDGNSESVRRPLDLDVADLDELSADTGYWQSTTPPTKAVSADKKYYNLPIWDNKQCMHLRTMWADHRRRMYNSNLISNIMEKYEEALSDVQIAIEADSSPDRSCVALKSALEAASNACETYVRLMYNAPPIGKTKLDREIQKMCLHEVEQIGIMAKRLKALITKHSIKDRIQTAYTYLNKLKNLCEDAHHAMPDIFVWMISNGKRLAYQRISAREIIYSHAPEERGKFCGKMQTLVLKWPGKKATTSSGWTMPAKIYIYFWLGLLKDKKHYIDGLPKGYALCSELNNANKLRSNAPATIFFTEKHSFQLRAYIYQARSLIGSDSSGLSDPFARVIINDSLASTQVINETLSPTWDELLLFEDVLLYSTIEQIKSDPPTIVIEIFDQNKVSKSEFIGRVLAKPHVKACEDIPERNQYPPTLEWHDVTRGDDRAGELLATFELLEIPPKQSSTLLPELPPPREANRKLPIDAKKEVVLPVPKGIRPTLSKYRIEVLFWGLREMKRVQLLAVNKPRVDIECAGHIICSSIIQISKRNPNFTNPVKYFDLELPDQDMYRPPVTVRVVDCRSFGRVTLVGTHMINSINKYIYKVKSKREKEAEAKKSSMIELQNVDLKNNCVIRDVQVVNGKDQESCPLLLLDKRAMVTYGSGSKKQLRKQGLSRQPAIRRRKSSTESVGGDRINRDWWARFYASVERMIILEQQAKKDRQGDPTSLYFIVDETRSPRDELFSPPPDRDHNRRQPTSPKIRGTLATGKSNEVPKSDLIKIYPHELEAVPEYEEFKDWLHSFELYRGKKTGDESEDANRIVGIFKGALKVYKMPLPQEMENQTVMGFDASHSLPIPHNDPVHVLVRVYVIRAKDLHPMDLNGKADPYVVLQLGSKKISDKVNYKSKQLNPVFGKCFEIEATIPQDSVLTIQIYDWDLLGTDELIGETKIDLENRFYSRHRATCGIPVKYEEHGYNRWRDSLRPTQILAKLCKDGKLDAPIYEYGRVKIGRMVFDISVEDRELFSNPNTFEEQMALMVLHRWQEMPNVGTHLVTEHVETRPLYNPSKPGIEQGKLEMWVDLHPMDLPAPGPIVDISPRKPKPYEMRVIIWNTDDVVLEDDAFFFGEKMSDIYVKGWLKGLSDCQSTDIHYRSLTGEGNFNWRFIYPFDYLEAEERIVISRKQTVFSWDQSEIKMPARLELQVWDADHFSADDFLGAITLDLSRFPRGAKSSNLCTLDMLQNDGSVPMVNIFKQKRIKGWWPFYIKRDTEEMELTGKVEAEIHLLTKDEAEKAPAGLGWNEPEALDKPTRPDASFMWFLNPLKSIRYIIWHNYKWTILKATIILLVALMFLLLVYAVPGYTVKKLLGA